MQKFRYYGIWFITILLGIAWVLGGEGSIFFTTIIDNDKLSHQCLGVMWLTTIPLIIMQAIAIACNKKPEQET